MADEETARLGLPYILPNQAQKHVTHNEAIRRLDALVQLSVRSRKTASPPEAPEEGGLWLVPGGATGAWQGWGQSLAQYVDGGWVRFDPLPGWRAWIEDDRTMIVWNGSEWQGLGGGGGGSSENAVIQNAVRFGLGTTADANNAFAARLGSALFTAIPEAEGGTGGVYLTLNRESPGSDLGLTLQTGYVTRAVMGLFGSDRFRLAVSDDGGAFRDGLIVDSATGVVDQPALPRFKAYTNHHNAMAVNAWSTLAINVTEFNDQNAFDPASSQFVAPVAGTYMLGASLLFKADATPARMRGRLVRNGTEQIRGSFAESPAFGDASALWLQTMVLAEAGDTFELQGQFRNHPGYFFADYTTFWGAKIG